MFLNGIVDVLMETGTLLSAISAGIALFACGGAWLSFIVQRKSAVETINAQISIGARNSRASVVSANRQKWIDAIRDDLTELLVSGEEQANLKRRIAIASGDGVLTQELVKRLKDRENELARLISFSETRIRLRLNHSEPDHQALIEAMRQYKRAHSLDNHSHLEGISRKIFKDEWTRLKKEASGVDPFVKEATPKRVTKRQM